MSKYQEALNTIVENSCPRETNCQDCEISSRCNCLMKYEVDVLQELVDKATPKKATQDMKSPIRYVNTYECPNCLNKFTGKISVYCYHCGQALDWSDEQ